MMIRRKRLGIDERVERVGREVFAAVKVGEDEIEATANSKDLYDGLRSRIAADGRDSGSLTQTTSGRPYRFGSGVFGERPVLRWTLAAAAVLLLLAVSAALWLSKPSPESTIIAQPPPIPALPSSPSEENPGTAPANRVEVQVAERSSHPDHPRRAAVRHKRATRRDGEVATGFFPLTFMTDPIVPDSGQMVRVKIPRSALIAFGVPMNVERSGELIVADVVIGDDGLARAIRFVQ